MVRRCKWDSAREWDSVAWLASGTGSLELWMKKMANCSEASRLFRVRKSQHASHKQTKCCTCFNWFNFHKSQHNTSGLRVGLVEIGLWKWSSENGPVKMVQWKWSGCGACGLCGLGVGIHWWVWGLWAVWAGWWQWVGPGLNPGNPGPGRVYPD